MSQTSRAAVSAIAYVGLGANLGDARAAVSSAIQAMDGLPATRLAARSSLYASAPVGATGPDYVNAVVALSTQLPPQELLEQLQAMELAAGRERPHANAPRTLDLDILLYGDLRINTRSLSVPHPRMKDRAFVLVPLAQIAPHLVTPSQLQSVAEQRVTRL
ncbi:MAG: 2-amino-4-hydroxy-6-hydroxymethyldihydropteridine diphosphokinase [Burkholderiales bacterium]|nr:2-amino-4-hydroxy-6-hydroxymethyldihydropteridine diphosphokinase [Burkholderiales bacterium]